MKERRNLCGISGLKTYTDEFLKTVLFQITGKPLLHGAAPEKGCGTVCMDRATVPFIVSPLAWLCMTGFSQISTLSTILSLLPEIISMLAAWPACKQLCWAGNEAIIKARTFYRKGWAHFSLNRFDTLMRLVCLPCFLSHLISRHLALLAV